MQSLNRVNKIDLIVQHFDKQTMLGLQGTMLTKEAGENNASRSIHGKWLIYDWKVKKGKRGQQAHAGVRIMLNRNQIPEWTVRKVWEDIPKELEGRVGAIRCRSRDLDICWIVGYNWVEVPGKEATKLQKNGLNGLKK